MRRKERKKETAGDKSYAIGLRNTGKILTPTGRELICHLDKPYLWHATTKPDKELNICLSPGKIIGVGKFNLRAVDFDALVARR